MYIGQVLQAEGIKSAIEAHRQEMPYCMESLYWQLNDCWPVASWSSTDYYGRCKALHYFVKNVFEQIHVSPTINDDVLNIFIISDSLNAFEADLNLHILNFSGESLWQKTIPVEVQANINQSYFSEKINNLIKGLKKEVILLKTSLVQNRCELSQNITYFLPVKLLNLPAPDIKRQVVPIENGYRIILNSDKLAKNVYLSADAREGFFTDNYFGLLPGEEVAINFLTTQKSTDFEKQLENISLRDSY